MAMITPMAFQTRMCAFWICFLCPLYLLCVFPSAVAVAQTVVLSVNGTPITDADIAMRQRLFKLLNKPTARDACEESLIADRLKFNEAARNHMDADDGAIAEAFRELAQSITLSPDAFSTALARAHIDPAHVRAYVRTDAAFLRLVKATHPTLAVRDEDVDAQIARAHAPNAEEIVMLPVVFVVRRSASSAEWDRRHREALAATAAFSDCWRDIDRLKSLPDVAISPAQYARTNTFAKTRQDALAKVATGHFAPFVQGQNGWESFALCARRTISESALNRGEVMQDLETKRLDAAVAAAYHDLRAKAVIARFE